MLTNDTMTVPADIPDTPGAPPSILSRPGSTAVTSDGAPTLRVIEDWATESGMTVQEFEDTYFEQCVTELVDGHPAVRQVDAERLVLNDEFWPAAPAA
ncbi:MAG TPA: hypothetical protein VFU98_03435 [Microlunatus sp.]|nr:hypothetical protein [Microlunatus sp.]